MERRTVVITGGSRGIGAACAAAFAAAGDRVVLCYQKSEKRAGALAKELTAAGGEAYAERMDVRSEAEVKRLFLRVEERFGGTDVLINSAGVSLWQLFTDSTEEEQRELMEVNFGGVCRTIRAAAPGMVRKKRGVIVNLSSMWGIAGASCEALYSASKAAVIGLSKALAKELGPSGVRVCCVAPGVIDTDMMAGFDEKARAALAEETPLSRLGTPEEVARAVKFLASEEASFITGDVLRIDGGYL